MDEIIQEIILQALRDNPKGLTTQEIIQIVEKKLKKIKIMLDIWNEL